MSCSQTFTNDSKQYSTTASSPALTGHVKEYAIIHPPDPLIFGSLDSLVHLACAVLLRNAHYDQLK
jgi:hypothetical protein